MTKHGNGRYNLSRLLLNHDTGDYFDKNGDIRKGSGVRYTKTSSFRLIPKSDLNKPNSGEIGTLPGHYSIDGERYAIEPVQVNTLPSVFKVFCLN
jgi:hypothetical protein